jgi:large subunit ribosomal protein L15
MKLHDLRPADGSRQPRTRVGRGIAAGKGKTAGRGTKGQKARAGGSIPPWFEGGQTPLHMRIPKLRGFKNRFKVEYEVVNIGAIGALAERGAFEAESPAKGAKAGPITINQDILRAVGLVRTLNKPLKVLGAGELATPLFVVADAFTASARSKIEAAGGSVNVLEVPKTPLAALGVEDGQDEGRARQPREPRTAAGRAAVEKESGARAAREAQADEPATEPAAATAPAAETPKAARRPKAAAAADTSEADASDVDVADNAPVEPARAAATADEAAGTADEADEPAEADTPAGDDA